MKKTKLIIGTILLLTLFCSCFSSYGHQHRYEVQKDGSWKCISNDCNKILENTDKSYIAILAGNTPVNITPLNEATDNPITIGTATVEVKKEDLSLSTEDMIVYSNNSADSEAQTIIIRTCGENLSVNGKIGDNKEESDEIIHYGCSEEVTVNVAQFCFYTHAIIGCMNLNEGKAIADENAYVGLVHTGENAAVKEQNGGVFIIPKETKTTEINLEIAIELGYEVSGDVYEAKSDKDVYEISSKEDLIEFRNLYNEGAMVSNTPVVLTADIDISDENWEPIGNWKYPYHGTFNGNGKTIKGLSAKPNEETIVEEPEQEKYLPLRYCW